jgi:hypothetical protein
VRVVVKEFTIVDAVDPSVKASSAKSRERRKVRGAER